MENVRKHRNIELITTERRRNYLVSKPNYHNTKFFTENLLAIEMKNIEILINTPLHFSLSILDLNETVIYEFWYDYVKPTLCYVGKDRLIVHYKHIIFIKILHKMLKQDLTIQNMN